MSSYIKQRLDEWTNLRGVVLLNVAENSDVVGFDKVDGDTLAAESTRTTDAMNVQLTITG